MFTLGAALLGLLAMAFAAWPMRRPVPDAALPEPAPVRDAANVAAWQTARAEIDAQLADGRIDASAHARAGREIDRRLLADADAAPAFACGSSGGVRMLLGGAIVIPLLAFALYYALGSWREVELDRLMSGMEDITDPVERTQRTLAMLPRLEAAAQAHDTEGNYRFLLARSYMALERYPEAAATFADLVRQYPEDAGLIAQQAQALYLAGDRQLTPAIQALVDRAFAIDPAQVTLLGMVGMDRFQRGEYAAAAQAWEKLLAQLPPDAPDAAVIRDGIAMARARLAGEPAQATHGADTVAAGDGQASMPAEPAPPATGAAPSLRVSVRLAEGLSAPPDATVFVFARAVSGPPMPLAVARFTVAELPKEVELNDTMAMAPGMTLSRFRDISVTARITRSGNVNPQPGDFEGTSGPTRLDGGEQQLAIVIDQGI